MDDEKKYLDLFLWVVVGIIIGTAIYVLVFDGQAETPTVPENQTNITNEGEEPVLEPTPVVNIKMITYECEDCASAPMLLTELGNMEESFAFDLGNVEEIPHDSNKGKELIEKYEIDRLPTMILSSNASQDARFEQVWMSQIGTVEDDGSLVFRELYPPYYDTDEGSIVGYVGAITISPTDCQQCEDMEGFIDFLSGEQVMMQISNRTSLLQNESEAMELIGKYNITKLPVFILKGDVERYSVYQSNIESLVSKEDDAYVLRQTVPPYVDISDGSEVRGIVDVVKLVDSECDECFDVDSLLGSLSGSFGFAIGNETTLNITSDAGAALLEEHNITKVPTLLVSSEASVYPGFEDAWESAGDRSGEWYVYRGHEGIADLEYRDLLAPGNQTTENETAPMNESS